MRQLIAAVAMCVAACSARAQAAPRVTASLAPAALRELDRIRTDVWVHWFSGDTTALRRVLGPELVAMSPGAEHWQSLSQTLASSAAFKAGGGRFVAVRFDSTTTHQAGDVVVMFSHYAVETERQGKRETQRGMATEVFVQHHGRWVHTSWQLGQAK
jgi:hypothetical protein